MCHRRKLSTLFIEWKKHFNKIARFDLSSCHPYNVAVRGLYCSVMLYSNSGSFPDQHHILSGVCKKQPFFHKCWDVFADTCPGNLTTFITDVVTLHTNICDLFNTCRYKDNFQLPWNVAYYLIQNDECKKAVAFSINSLSGLVAARLLNQGSETLAKWLTSTKVRGYMSTLWNCIIASLENEVQKCIECGELIQQVNALMQTLRSLEYTTPHMSSFFKDYGSYISKYFKYASII